MTLPSSQGLSIEPSTLGYPRDYYGKPTHKEVLIRYDFAQTVEFRAIGRSVDLSASWSKKYPGRRPLGIAPSGKFAVYLLKWVPAGMTREDLSIDLCRIVPPTDNFFLDYTERYQWMRQAVKLPLVLPERTAELVHVEHQEVQIFKRGD